MRFEWGPSGMKVRSTTADASLLRACLFFGMGTNMNGQVYNRGRVWGTTEFNVSSLLKILTLFLQEQESIMESVHVK
jgi:hypothetical protein